jgi:aryl-alcohol dehydrogenase-like predicted oxidoreductase
VAVHEVKDHSLAAFDAQLAETRRLLGRHLRLYQIHSATAESGVLDDGEVLDALARLRDDGVRIGLSLSGARQAETLERALGIERGGTALFGCVQATWNLLEPSAGPALVAAHAAGLGVIVKEALANGQLVAPDGIYPEAWRTLSREADRLGTSVDALALAAALAQPWADCVLSGAVRAEHLSANVAALALDVPKALLAGLEALAVPAPEYWARRARLSWT